MKRTIAILALLLGSLPAVAHAGIFEDDNASPNCIAGNGVSFETFFSPSAEVAPAVVKEIQSAKKSIRIATRMFASKSVSEALVAAGRAKIDVKIVLDGAKNSTGYSNSTFLLTMGYPPHLTSEDSSLYVSYMVVDEADVVQGSIATLADLDSEKKNPTGVVIIHNAPELAKKYLADWQMLWDNSAVMKPAKK